MNVVAIEQTNFAAIENGAMAQNPDYLRHAATVVGGLLLAGAVAVGLSTAEKVHAPAAITIEHTVTAPAYTTAPTTQPDWTTPLLPKRGK